MGSGSLLDYWVWLVFAGGRCCEARVVAESRRRPHCEGPTAALPHSLQDYERFSLSELVSTYLGFRAGQVGVLAPHAVEAGARRVLPAPAVSRQYCSLRTPRLTGGRGRGRTAK